jgi:hypothetical protein
MRDDGEVGTIKGGGIIGHGILRILIPGSVAKEAAVGVMDLITRGCTIQKPLQQLKEK